MKLYRLFYDDATDLNRETIEIGKTYTKENFDREELFAYFGLEDLHEKYNVNRSDQNFKVYEVDLNNNIHVFVKDYEYYDRLSADNLTILNEIDYSIFNDKNFDSSYLLYAVKVLKLEDKDAIQFCLKRNIDVLNNLLAMIDIDLDINNLINNKHYITIETLIKKGKREYLDVLSNSDDPIIKELVAKFS